MFNGNGLIATVLAIVVGVVMIPVIGSSVAGAEERSTTESFTAENDDTVQEVVTLTNTPIIPHDSEAATVEEAMTVTVNDVALDVANYSVSGNVVTLDASASNIGDEIDVSYTYEKKFSNAIGSLVELLPLLFVVIVVSGVVVAVAKTRR